MELFIGGDHAGFDLKEKVKELLAEKGMSVKDFGPHSSDSVDYPDFVHPLAAALKDKAPTEALGILICGSGNGVCITANKHAHIRAALCWDKDLATLARSHNNANVLCLPARFVTKEAAFDMVEAFLSATFEGGRHERRVEKIAQ